MIFIVITDRMNFGWTGLFLIRFALSMNNFHHATDIRYYVYKKTLCFAILYAMSNTLSIIVILK